MATDEQVPKLPNLDLAQARFLLATQDYAQKPEKQSFLLDTIKQNNMTHYYQELCEAFKWQVDAELVATMKKANAEELQRLADKLDDAEKNLGEIEVRDAWIAKAEYLTKIGDKDGALAAFRACQEKAGAVGPRLDLIFTQIRIGFFYNDHELVERNMAKAKLLIEEGGDWDRRNRLKVYEALHLLRQRSFRQAAQLFAETLATFTSTEIFSYEDLVFYTVVSAIVSLDRVTLKSKLVDSPEIHTVIHKIPHLGEFLNAYYDGEYATFLEKLLDVMQLMQLDRYLSQHTHWFCREMRVRAYAQFLESYRSVQVRSMADTFGVSTQILDKELSRFISTGRLNCKIDKVGGIIETNRPDTRNAQYHSTLKQGDSLLNRLQKLSRVINL